MSSKFDILSYLSIARIDHWPKQIFMVAGIFIAFMVSQNNVELSLIYKISFGLLSTSLIASGNYVINEWFDKDTDIFHPTKKFRPAPMGKLNFKFVIMEYILLIFLGLLIAFLVNKNFFIFTIIFITCGLIYNIPPIRTKDIIYLDVCFEAINNPIRLFLGWVLVIPEKFPPLSLILIFWFGGMFLMAMKRFAEYKMIKKNNSPLSKYRESFNSYSSNKLLLFSFLSAICSAFAFSTFVVKYKPEIILIFPILSLLFTYYLHLALQEDSIVQTPEKLFKDKGILLIILIGLLVFITVLRFDINIINNLVNFKAIF